MKRHKFLIAMGAKIRQLRIAKDWLQRDLAKAANLDINYIGGVERGERNISTLNLVRIAKVLKVNLKELFDFHFSF